MSYVIGVDIGGTNIACGLIDTANPEKILAKCSVKTAAPRSCESICDDIAAMCKSLANTAGVPYESIASIGAGCPGIIQNGVVKFAGNLHFNNSPLADLLSAKTGKNIILCNDGSAAAYGEYICGAGKGRSSLIAVTIGTGIGGGIIINGKIFEGFNNAGSEIGHIIIEKGGRQCACGNKGCFEAYCSATALIIDSLTAMQINKASKMWQVCDNDISNVNGSTAFDAARLGDKTAENVVDEYLNHLAFGIHNLITLFQPEIICLGGGISNEGDALLNPLLGKIDAMSITPKETPSTYVTLATLGGDAGIIGAAMYSLSKKEIA